MKLPFIKGKYVVAVSGGVDSAVLLNLLYTDSQKNKDLDLVVAHFDHGIRSDSYKDEELAHDLAKKYGLTFYSTKGKLGPKTSEQAARTARYKFLNDVLKKEQADGIITAHHQDDLIETAILNIIRGTGRKGISSLSSSKALVRPLLSYPKSEIESFAKKQNLSWREDITNNDLKYLRNYVRRTVVPRLDKDSRTQLVSLITRQLKLNEEIDKKLGSLLKDNSSDNKLSRLWLNSLDNSLSMEILAAWLRQNNIRDFDHRTIERLSSQLKTISPGKAVDVINKWQVLSSSDNLALRHVER